MTSQTHHTPEAFAKLIARVTARISGRTLDNRLEADLNAAFPAGGWDFRAIFNVCQVGIEAGWMCAQEAGSIKFGRVMKAGPITHGFSVDVVEMPPIAGPHHSHPNGEIDLIMPLVPEARFDGRGAGWLVYGPGTAHRPTVTDGRALILYLLPGGAIEFTQS
jgi:Domain of unknown function (DUF4863)